MPDTLDQPGFDPEHNFIGEEARAQLAQMREAAIRVTGVITGDTQVAQQRTTLLLMTAAVAVAFAPIGPRVAGLVALLLTARRRWQ